MSNRSRFSPGSRILEEQLQTLILSWTQLTNDVARQIFPGQLRADPALRSLDPDDVVKMIVAELVGSLKDGLGLRRNRLFAPRPQREDHGETGQRGPLGTQVEHVIT